MAGRAGWWVIPVAMAATFLIGACSSRGASGSPSGAPGTPVASPTGSIPAVTSRPVTSGAPSPAATASTEPPAASLKADGGDPVVGQLGSYTWNGGGSDSPWLQGWAIHVGAGELLTATLAGEPEIGSWTVQRVPAGANGGSGTFAMGSGEGSPIGFVAPNPGSWSILVDVRFANGSDAAAYYWLLEVR